MTVGDLRTTLLLSHAFLGTVLCVVGDDFLDHYSGRDAVEVAEALDRIAELIAFARVPLTSAA